MRNIDRFECIQNEYIWFLIYKGFHSSYDIYMNTLFDLSLGNIFYYQDSGYYHYSDGSKMVTYNKHNSLQFISFLA